MLADEQRLRGRRCSVPKQDSVQANAPPVKGAGGTLSPTRREGPVDTAKEDGCAPDADCAAGAIGEVHGTQCAAVVK